MRSAMIDAATVLAALKVRPGGVGASCAISVPADLDRACARRPVQSAVGAKEGLRRGRTKEGAAKKELEFRSSDCCGIDLDETEASNLLQAILVCRDHG